MNALATATVRQHEKPKLFLMLNSFHEKGLAGIASRFGEVIEIRREQLSGLSCLNDHNILITDSKLRTDDFTFHGGQIVYIGREPVSESNMWRISPSTVDHELLPTLEKIRAMDALYEQIVDANLEISRLNELTSKLGMIGIALTSEQDLGKLLHRIVSECRYLTNSDGGSIYVAEENAAGERQLKFAVAQNETIKLRDFKEALLPIDENSIVGHVVLSGEALNIADVYALQGPYRYNSSFDQKHNYRVKSMLTLPLKDASGEIIGALQLVNKKRKFTDILNSPADVEKQVVPYSKAEIEYISHIATQAAVAIEKTKLYSDIEKLFEGFVEASLSAFERRDMVAFGHSRRIAVYSLATAQAINQRASIPDSHFSGEFFDDNRMKALKIASLLHDFGKIAVREAVLTKKSRLNKEQMELVRERFTLVMQMERFLNSEPEEKVNELKDDISFISKINGLNRLDEGQLARLILIKNKTYRTPEGLEKPLLTDNEFKHLSIRRGNLTDEELDEVRSHVVHTEEILSKMPWTKELRKVPKISGLHHERMDGSGYPSGKMADELPLEARIIAIADMFDALTAMDRPYKPAHSKEDGLAIIAKDVEKGRLDRNIFDIFVEDRIYLSVEPDSYSKQKH